VTVELHRPEALNAMNTAMGEDLLHCFDAFTWDTTARAVVFAGAGDKAFCVGGDLKEREGMTDEAWRAQHLIFEQAAARVLHCPGARHRGRRGLRHGRAAASWPSSPT
jgi:enoyl-CoA hydratase/carnithine racemase